MKVVQAVTFAVALATLCLLQALQTEARDIVGRDTWCPCDPQGPPYQLLRGSDQVHKCEVGFYCDCAHQKRLQCFAPPFIKWKYDEDNQVCALRFDCAAFFRRVTTTTVPPTSPTKPPTTAPPTTEPSTAAPTTAAPTTTEPPTTEPSTTEPTTTKPTTTEPPTTEPPTTKVPTTAEPSTTPSTPEPTTAPTTTVTDASTTTVAPTTMPTTLRPRAHCTCNPNGPAYQLIRGDDELQKCYDGYYCDCRNREVYGCLDIWGIGWRFDEKTQRCEFEFDCQGYLRPTTTAAPTTEPSTTVPPTTEPSTTAAPTTEPSTTAPPTTEPSTTVPPTTEPSTTAPPTTEPSTTAPPTTEPSTTVPSTRPTEAPTTAEPSTTEPSTTEATSTAKPGPLAECNCDRWWDREYELVRGEDQASSCTHGYYCDCSQYKRLRCFNVLTLGWRFDEDSQKCRFFNSCSALSN